MNRIQQYLFSNVLRAVITIVAGLSLLALLAQGLSRTDLIVDNRQSALTFLKVVALGAPQIIALLAPMALFVATLNALNRAHRDSEIVVSHAAGMTRWQVLSPILRLGMYVAVFHLCVNLFIQPLAQRELRETIADARADLVTSLIRPGAFSFPTEQLTVYVRDMSNGVMHGMLISDSRNKDQTVDYIAERGIIVQVDGQPAIRMLNGQIQQVDKLGQLSILDFADYVFELNGFLAEDSELHLKPSDRFLYELVFPDLSDFMQNRDQVQFMAEANARLASPLLNLVMCIIAVMTVIGGDFSRRGYQTRIFVSVAGALFVIMITLAIQSGATDDPALNPVQYIFPVGLFLILTFIFLSGNRLQNMFRSARRKQPKLKGAA